MQILFLLTLILITSPAFAADTAVDEGDVPEKTLKQIAVLISSQIRPCWKIPVSTNPAPLQAVINISPSGNLKFVGFSGEIGTDQDDLAKSVKEAIADPKCNPIKNLPPQELYDVWQNLTLLFAPKN